MQRCLSGNEAVTLAALNCGASVITGYPGTPSSEAIGSIWGKEIDGVTVQWSTNEKVALEIAAAAAWAGKRALCTMKMSGLNVAYDSAVSIAYSGCTGALVIYVCDDPGVSAGMPEQDVRGFAKMTDMPVIEPSSVEDSYYLAKYAFELSEKIQSPVMLRSVTNVALSHATIDLPDDKKPVIPDAHMTRNIEKYTKAGARICMEQHKRLIASLEQAKEQISHDRINTLTHGSSDAGLVAVGVMCEFIDEGIAIAKKYANVSGMSVLRVKTSVPSPDAQLDMLIQDCKSIAVVEENEPYVEREAYLRAFKLNKHICIVGKEDGTLSRVGSFDAFTMAKAILALFGKKLPDDACARTGAEANCTARPIGVCAGCPHRGVFMSINAAVKKNGYKKDDVIITGDIGCTILGMSPPFNTLWTEVAMGASIPMAQGFHYAGIKTPVIATIGDSTFLHGGIPGLINAVQNNVDMTAIIMDNGWTGMTGMQVNAGTANEFQAKSDCVRVDIAKLVPALGVTDFTIVDPYDINSFTDVLSEAIKRPGLKVILARRECAIQAGRRGVKYAKLHIDAEKCRRCKVCVTKTGCPALVYANDSVTIDKKLCNGCSICMATCAFGAIVKEEV